LRLYVLITSSNHRRSALERDHVAAKHQPAQHFERVGFRFVGKQIGESP
jgi:hypothetical protein